MAYCTRLCIVVISFTHTTVYCKWSDSIVLPATLRVVVVCVCVWGVLEGRPTQQPDDLEEYVVGKVLVRAASGYTVNRMIHKDQTYAST
jgi:hypothetical protein